MIYFVYINDLSNIPVSSILDDNHMKKLNNFGHHSTTQLNPRQKKIRKQKLMSEYHSRVYPDAEKKSPIQKFGGNQDNNNLGNTMGRKTIGNQVLNSIMRAESES